MDEQVEVMAYQQKEAAGALAGKPTQREQLMAKRQRLSAQLANIDAALAALDAHPDLEEFVKVLGRAI